MDYYYQYKFVAATGSNYNDGAYGTSTYNGESTGTGSEGSGGDLAYTGYDVIVPAALGIAIVIASAILLAKKLLRRRQA